MVALTFHHAGTLGGPTVPLAADINRALPARKEPLGGGAGWTPHVTLLTDEPAETMRAVPCV